MSQAAHTNTETASFLLEIGSEEIPARFIGTARTELRARTETLLRESHLSWQQIRVLATPRRMALLIDGLEVRQPDRDLEIKGPPVSVAFDADGNPTKAAEGFARKSGVDLATCERGQDQRGEFLLARRTEAGQSAADVLQQKLPGVITSLPFRKVMRWGNHDLEYPRPLQWLVALLGQEVVPLEVGYLQAGRLSRGHRTLAKDQTVEIPQPQDYEKILEGVGVIVDQDKRRRLIEDGFAAQLSRYDEGAELVFDEDLMAEVVQLLEYPTPFLGSYDEMYFALPAEVITTALKAHQRYFTVSRPQGTGLLPRFAAVRDGGTDHLDNVVAGNERVLHARLADALFYWTFDQKKSPDERMDMLNTVTWLEGYGTVLDKTHRLQTLVTWLWENGLGDSETVPADLLRATTICKSDLVSEMIKDGKEFTKLEGFIGARYADLAGENTAVCTAIERHYHPRSATGELPGDRISSVLSLADRLDTVAGCWKAGFIPTGAKDPYALRRHVLAVVRLLMDLNAHLDLDAALAQSLDGFSSFNADKPDSDLLGELGDFVRTRLAGYLVENKDRDPEIVRAVLPVRWRDPVDALNWVHALEGYRGQEDFQQLATGFKRCRNILKGDVLPKTELDRCLARWQQGGRGSQNEDLGGLIEPAEIALRDQVAAAAADLAMAENSGDYDRVFSLLSGFGPTIDNFFDSVRVNVDDVQLKMIRHAFLREIHGLFARYAEFSEIAVGDS